MRSFSRSSSCSDRSSCRMRCSTKSRIAGHAALRFGVCRQPGPITPSMPAWTMDAHVDPTAYAGPPSSSLVIRRQPAFRADARNWIQARHRHAASRGRSRARRSLHTASRIANRIARGVSRRKRANLASRSAIAARLNLPRGDPLSSRRPGISRASPDPSLATPAAEPAAAPSPPAPTQRHNRRDSPSGAPSSRSA